MKKGTFYILAAIFCVAFHAAALRAQTDDRKVEVGVLVTAINLRSSTGEKPLGIGGRFGYSFTKYAALDTEVSYFPQDPSGNFGETIVLAGVKAGFRNDKFGVFGKLRPGVAHFGGSAFNVRNNSPNKFALDVGGVGEFYPTKRTIIRVDVGDTIIPFGNDTLAGSTSPPIRRPGTTHNLQTTFGVGFRF